MMQWIAIILVIAGSLAVALLFSGKIEFKSKTREQYLDELNSFVEGKKESLDIFPNSFRIIFTYQDREFEFEDIEFGAEGKKQCKGLLKTRTKGSLTMNFTESVKASIRGDIQRASDIDEAKSTNVMVPKELSEFKIFANDTRKGNLLLRQDEVLKVLTRMKYKGERGHPVIPIIIQDGVVAIEFHSSFAVKPNILDLQENVTAIDVYAKDLAAVAGVIDEIESIK